MKIKLLTELGYLSTAVILKIPHERISSSIVVDTGSPETVISYSDARRLKIPFSKKAEIISFGGRKFQGYSYNRVEIIFHNEEGKPITEELTDVKVIRPTSLKDIEEVDRIPTILGTDFLKQTKYKLFCDMAKQEAYLEK